jgi:hypothetical protein
VFKQHPHQQALIDKIKSQLVQPLTYTTIDDSAMPPLRPLGPGELDELFDKNVTGPSMQTIFNWSQSVGRALRSRLVHAQRTRKLRRRGEAVRFAGYNHNGNAMYTWTKHPKIIDFKHDPKNVGRNLHQECFREWVFGKAKA